MNKNINKVTKNEPKAIQDDDLENVTGGGGYLPEEQCPTCGTILVYNGIEERSSIVYIHSKCPKCDRGFAYTIRK